MVPVLVRRLGKGKKHLGRCSRAYTSINCYSMQSIHFETQAKMYMGGIKGPDFSLAAIIGNLTATDAKLTISKSLFPSGPCMHADNLKADIRQIESLFCIRCCVWGNCSEYSLFISAQQRIRQKLMPRSNKLPPPVVHNHRGVTKPGLCCSFGHRLPHRNFTSLISSEDLESDKNILGP